MKQAKEPGIYVEITEVVAADEPGGMPYVAGKSERGFPLEAGLEICNALMKIRERFPDDD